jgi:hypothetical protein
MPGLRRFVFWYEGDEKIEVEIDAALSVQNEIHRVSKENDVPMGTIVEVRTIEA